MAFRVARLGLDVGVLDMDGLERAGGDHRRSGQGRRRIAPDDPARRQEIAGHIVVEPHRAGIRRGVHLGEHRQRLPHDGDLVVGDAQDGLGIADQRDDGLAPVPDVPVGEHLLILARRVDAVAVHARDVCRGEDTDESGVRGVEASEVAEDEPGMGMRRADDPERQGARGRLVGAEPRGAGDLVDAVHSGDPGADRGTGARGIGCDLGRGRVPDGLDDLAIPGAPAEDPAERVLDLELGRVRVGVEQRIRRHEHARRADPALRRAGAQEGGLDRPELVAIRQPLHRGHVATGQLAERHQARADRFAIQPDRAGATVTRVAADLRPGEAKVVAQDLGEPAHRVAQDRHIRAVDPEGGGLGHAVSSAAARRTSTRAASRR